MTDAADRAQEREEADRDAALARARDNTAHEAPFEIEGRRVCLDCFEPIDKRRLKANPAAVRCLECQTLIERRHRGPA